MTHLSVVHGIKSTFLQQESWAFKSALVHTAKKRFLHYNQEIKFAVDIVNTTSFISYILDAVGSWQIILPMPNLERPYYSDKESEAVLKCLQYKRCAGPQKVSKFRF